MGALFEKPYTEFEFNGQIYKVGPTVGGHNGVGQQACIAHPPSYDPAKGRWVVHVDNNLIHIDYSDQTEPRATFGADSPFTKLVIQNNPDPARPSGGILITQSTDADADPEYPVDCEFTMQLRAEVPGLPPLVTRAPLRLFAGGLQEWPPPVGTAYANTSGADFYLEESAAEGDQPMARILPGDSTILTQVFAV
jgi:hypothetical protein